MNTLILKKIKGMEKSFFSLTVILAFGLVLSACTDTYNPVSESASTTSISIPEVSAIGVNDTDPVTIQGFTITFNGNSYDPEAHTSTFSYTVNRSSSASGFNYMAFEIPSCAAGKFAGHTPLANSVTETEIRWTSSIGSGQSRDYSVTYAGKVATGMTDATIQSSGTGTDVTKQIPGPCKGIYSISGFVYVDEDGNQTRSAGEAGIGNVTIYVSDNEGNSTGSVVTAADGSYTFEVFTGGDDKTFKLEVPSETPENADDNNELLAFTYIVSEGLGGLNVVIGNANVHNKNFGFTPDTQGIIDKFENPGTEGAILLNTKEPEYWRNELFFSTRGRQTDFTQTQLLHILTEIEQLDLTFTFNFGSNKISEAIDLLTIKLNGRNPSSPLDILKSELLAAKLNVVSGNGAVGTPDFDADEFNLLILKTGAAAAAAETGGTELNGLLKNSYIFESTSTDSTYLNSDGKSTSNLLTSFNRSGTGGGGIGN